jgi:flavin reductase (DIM6/NTAB) family NADH-FMN oxidoreductase RutF/rubredoxin
MNIEAFFKISYGLYIVTVSDGQKNNGFIANAVFQVTAEPPQFAICCNKDNFSNEILKNSNSFAFSVLQQNARSELFSTFGYKSGRNTDKFADVKYFKGETGTPIVTDDCVAWFECKIVNSFEVGTHIVYIGELVDNDLLSSELESITYAYYRDVKKAVAPKNAPTYIDKKKYKKEKKQSLPKYDCQVCGYIYDPAEGDVPGGIAPGTKFEDIPDDWTCPICGTTKQDFIEVK